MNTRYLYSIAAALITPAVARLWINHAQLQRNYREIHNEWRDGIGIVDSDRLNEFENREIERQLSWEARSWKDLFTAPPDVNWSGLYGKLKILIDKDHSPITKTKKKPPTLHLQKF